MRTNFYIDGFNFYYGCLKGTSWRWLDLEKFCRALLPKHDVGRIRYFTARVKDRPGFPPGTEVRQQIYLRALAKSKVDIHYGHYENRVSRAALHPIPKGKPASMVKITKPEEKGSDVNLATYLLVDAFKGDFEQAVVVSNDADLATPIQMVRDEFKLPIGIAFPCTNGRSPCARLLKVATFYRDVRKSTLKKSQLPENMTDAKGAFIRPARWK